MQNKHDFKKKPRRNLGLGACVLCSVALMSCSEKETLDSRSISDIQKEQGVPVESVTAKRSDLKSVEILGGTVEGYYQTVVSTGSPGTLTKLHVSVGDRVQKNSVLAVVEPDMTSALTIAQAQFDNAKKSFERVKALAEEGAVSLETVEQVETGFVAAREQLKAARKSERVLAPFAGTVLEVYETANRKVGPGARVAKIARWNKIRVVVEVNERLISRYREGQDAFILMDGDTITGTVEKVALGANSMTHGYPLWIVFPNPDMKIKPGSYVLTHIVTQQSENTLHIPMDIVQVTNDESWVYAIQGNAAVKTVISTGIRGQGQIEVLDGLDDAARVVSRGASLLSDGARVHVVSN